MEQPRPTEFQTLHFDLRHCPDGATYQLHCRGKRIELRAHDGDSRARACKSNAAFAGLAPEHHATLTHYAEDVELPADVPAHYYVTRRVEGLAINELHPLCLSFIHIPSTALQEARRRIVAQNARPAGDPRLAHFGLEASDDLDTHLALQNALDQFKSPQDAAFAVVNQHPQLISQNTTTTSRVMLNHVMQAKGIGGLVTAISSQGTDGWAVGTPSVDHTGKEIAWGKTFPDQAGKTVYHYKLTDETAAALVQPTGNAVNTVQNDTDLMNRKWSVQHGTPDKAKHAPAVPGGDAAFAAQTPGPAFVLNNQTPGHGLAFDTRTLNYQPGATPADPATFSIDITNHFLRILWAWVQYLDHQGNVLDQKGNRAPSDTYTAINGGLVTSVNTVLAIPIDSAQTLSLPWPEQAASIRIINAGMGQNITNHQLAWRAILMTSVFQFVIPAALMAGGAALEKGGYYKKWTGGKQMLELLLSVLESVFGSAASQGASNATVEGALAGVENGGAAFVVSNLFEMLTIWIAEKLAAAEIIDSVPVAGWIARVTSMVITGASIIETSVEVGISPSLYEVDITRVITVTPKVLPDPTTGTPDVPATWPATALGGHCLFQIQYKDGTNFSHRGDMPTTTNQDPISFSFANLPSGGSFQIVFGVYSNDNWLAGKWTSGWIDAVPPAGGGPIEVQGAIIQSLARLTVETRYDFAQSLAYDGAAHVWRADARPTAVVTDLGQQLYECSEITINDKAYMLGYSWQAAGLGVPQCSGDGGSGDVLYVFQNINIGAHPQELVQV